MAATCHAGAAANGPVHRDTLIHAVLLQRARDCTTGAARHALTWSHAPNRQPLDFALMRAAMAGTDLESVSHACAVGTSLPVGTTDRAAMRGNAPLRRRRSERRWLAPTAACGQGGAFAMHRGVHARARASCRYRPRHCTAFAALCLACPPDAHSRRTLRAALRCRALRAYQARRTGRPRRVINSGYDAAFRLA